MEKLFLVCNAHLDPVWLWDWQEGATAAVATFRTAAEICEETDGFVFCHNEALLYQWVEEYDPSLFRKIQTLVAAGKWHIMGGWFLQPDCNTPSGESILRQIITGRKYFRKHFAAEPRVAVNVDTFGHSRGLVQILKQCGYTGYVFMRPEKERMDLPARNFLWEGFDGSKIPAHRLDRSYRSFLGQAVDDVTDWCKTERDEEISLFTWGIGNHGGGPSREDVAGLDVWMQQHPELSASHATPEAFFDALEASGKELPVFSDDLRPVFVGCYTSQARLKRLHRQLESRLYATEKLLSAASAQGLIVYPENELKEAERDLLFCEFHDIQPGTTIPEGEASATSTLHHGLEILSRLQMRSAMALLAGQPRALPEQTPVFLYNPHPYPVTGDFTFEIMPSDQNWSQAVRNTVIVRRNGEIVPSQEEKPSVNMNLDWRKRVTVHATLEPSSMNRFDCAFELRPCEKQTDVTFPQGTFCFDNGEMQLRINAQTGLIDSYRVGGTEYLLPGAFCPVAYQDIADPWHMDGNCFTEKISPFRPASPKQAHRYSDGAEITVPAVRIVEDGPVRTLVEAEFCWKQSRVIQTYILPKSGTAFHVAQRIIWNEADTMLKLEIPTPISGKYLGQGLFGSGELPNDGTECVSQKWCGLFGSDHALTIANTGTYGSHCIGGTISLSLLHSPAYAAHPIETRPLVHQERDIPRMDQGEHTLSFTVCGGTANDRLQKIDFEAQVQNEAPFIFSAFPDGTGELPSQAVRLSDSRVQLSAMFYDSERGCHVLRLWNSQNCPIRVTVTLPIWNTEQTVTLSAYQFQTYRVSTDVGLEDINAI